MKVFVVMGTTGEYSDRTEWAVCAYFDEQKAQEHVENATRRANELYIKARRSYWDIERGANEFDPNMISDYTGTTYYTIDVEIKDAIEL